ncbi:DUF4158 domain-containing protein [Streptomyces sp. NPDC007369]|uniref:DUF4158 domain-containing protein n=1 Tax=Streptomyces sp. NPDC007369 TaxID=3154589 RepID=UPI0034099AE7
MLKFLQWRGWFPKVRLELPRDAVEHVGRQVGVAASEPAPYEFTARTAMRHSSEIRDVTGRHRGLRHLPSFDRRAVRPPFGRWECVDCLSRFSAWAHHGRLIRAIIRPH